jgi:hypothetical protein
MMRATASLKRHGAGWLACEEIEQLASRQLAAEHHRTSLVGAMRMKNTLGDIQTDCSNL